MEPVSVYTSEIDHGGRGYSGPLREGARGSRFSDRDWTRPHRFGYALAGLYHVSATHPLRYSFLFLNHHILTAPGTVLHYASRVEYLLFTANTRSPTWHKNRPSVRDRCQMSCSILWSRRRPGSSSGHSLNLRRHYLLYTPRLDCQSSHYSVRHTLSPL